jgi:hypothetical protein
MIFLYRPGRTLFWSLIFGTYGGVLAFVGIVHTPWPDRHPLWFPVIMGGVTFCVSAFIGVTAMIWICRRFATFYTTAWRRK